MDKTPHIEPMTSKEISEGFKSLGYDVRSLTTYLSAFREWSEVNGLPTPSKGGKYAYDLVAFNGYCQRKLKYIAKNAPQSTYKKAKTLKTLVILSSKLIDNLGGLK